MHRIYWQKRKCHIRAVVEVYSFKAICKRISCLQRLAKVHK